MDLQEQRITCLRMAVDMGCKADFSRQNSKRLDGLRDERGSAKCLHISRRGGCERASAGVCGVTR